MTLLETINNDITVAMKAQNKVDLSILRMLKSAVKNEEINSKNESLSDEEIVAVIKKQVKIRKDSKAEYEKYARNDLVESLNHEIDVLSKYLPEELSEEEINRIIDEVFLSVQPSGIKDMGLLMKELTPILASKADMSLVSKIVKDKLTN